METRENFKRDMLLFIFLAFLPAFFLAQDAQSMKEDAVVRTVDDEDIQWGPCPEFMPAGCEIAVLHGNPEKANADILFRVPANTDIPNHTHTSAERMILISGEMEIAYEGEEKQMLSAGSYAYGPAGKPHTAKCGDQGPCVLFIAFEEPLDAFPVKKK